VTTEDLFTSLAEKGETYKVQAVLNPLFETLKYSGKILSPQLMMSMRILPPKNIPSYYWAKWYSPYRGNLQNYLKEASSRQMNERRRELYKLTQQLNLAAETYIVLGIAFPVILTTLLSMMGIFGGT